MFKTVPFQVPSWASCLENKPQQRLHLGSSITPILPFSPPGLPDDVKMYIKRDDYSGFETSGNKLRKLEFLFADILEKKADCIVTCGGTQSNHCRATAIIARMLGIDSYLLTFSRKPEEDPGLVGNLLFDRLIGSTLIQMTVEEFLSYGSDAMIEKTCERLRAKGKNPYAVPVGGSNGLGTWGYIRAIDELSTQLESMELNISDIACACGSGGTATGIGLGTYLKAKNGHSSSTLFDSSDTISAHAYIVCADEEHFHKHIDNTILVELGAPSTIKTRDFLQITNAQGKGYAQNTSEELQFIADVALKTGVFVDPVYSGKALYHLIRELQESPSKFKGKEILFVHTGGQFGLYNKIDQLAPIVEAQRPRVERFTME